MLSWHTNPFAFALSSPQVSTGVVSVSLFDADGVPIAISGLDDPVVFALDTPGILAQFATLTDGFRCAYFDSSKNDWSIRGVAFIAFQSDGTPLCGSLHLTDFAGMLPVVHQPTSSYSGFNITVMKRSAAVAVVGMNVILTSLACVRCVQQFEYRRHPGIERELVSIGCCDRHRWFCCGAVLVVQSFRQRPHNT
jgi:hypothetical protein